MNTTRNISKVNEQMLNSRDVRTMMNAGASWHQDYANSKYVFVGNLHTGLNECDVIIVMSQYGKVKHCNLVRDKDTGKSKGFAFVGYADQRSTTLAVDNFNGANLLGRTLRCDHVKDYKKPENEDDDCDIND